MSIVVLTKYIHLFMEIRTKIDIPNINIVSARHYIKKARYHHMIRNIFFHEKAFSFCKFAKAMPHKGCQFAQTVRSA